MGMDNSIRFVSAAFACCEKWLFSCMLLIVFFPPLERVLPTLPNPFPGQYMLYVKVALAGSFSIILINAKSKGWAKQCRTTRAFPSLLRAICSLLLTFLILPFPPSISGNQSAKKQQPFNPGLIDDIMSSSRSGQSSVGLSLPTDLLLTYIPVLCFLPPHILVWIKSINRSKILQGWWRGQVRS